MTHTYTPPPCSLYSLSQCPLPTVPELHPLSSYPTYILGVPKNVDRVPGQWMELRDCGQRALGHGGGVYVCVTAVPEPHLLHGPPFPLPHSPAPPTLTVFCKVLWAADNQSPLLPMLLVIQPKNVLA